MIGAWGKEGGAVRSKRGLERWRCFRFVVQGGFDVLAEGRGDVTVAYLGF